ncbi:hypothetical protein T4D_8077 [Trichinella pseudospiralis]|uniref:Uncharacterized protein n=1 Tax=Trichinella pseudospiralis TaxID=6337 RepID=A0A0V1G139_TRIPS|nr:hypothetical protein T4D_8077 [Trichinella pseudospiralis]
MRRAGRARDAIPRQLYFCYAIFARALWRTRVSWCSATAGAAVDTPAVFNVPLMDKCNMRMSSDLSSQLEYREKRVQAVSDESP